MYSFIIVHITVHKIMNGNVSVDVRIMAACDMGNIQVGRDCHEIWDPQGFKCICKSYFNIWSICVSTDLLKLSNEQKYLWYSLKVSSCLMYVMFLKHEHILNISNLLKWHKIVDHFHKSTEVSCSPSWMSATWRESLHTFVT